MPDSIDFYQAVENGDLEKLAQLYAAHHASPGLTANLFADAVSKKQRDVALFLAPRLQGMCDVSHIYIHLAQRKGWTDVVALTPLATVLGVQPPTLG